MVLVDPRRFVQRVGMLVVAGFAVTSFVFGQVASANDSQAEQVYYSVASGDTLWKIAADQAPNQDPRDLIAQLVELNKLTTDGVTPGQRLLLPNG